MNDLICLTSFLFFSEWDNAICIIVLYADGPSFEMNSGYPSHERCFYSDLFKRCAPLPPQISSLEINNLIVVVSK